MKKEKATVRRKAPSGRELSPQATEGERGSKKASFFRLYQKSVNLTNIKTPLSPSTAKAIPLPLGGRHEGCANNAKKDQSPKIQSKKQPPNFFGGCFYKAM